MLEHKHLIVAVDCNKPPKDEEEAVAFLQFLIKRVDMNIAKAETMLQNPHGYYCNLPGNEGVTAVGILETSHCAIHSWNITHPFKFQFDLYSCKDYDIDFVIDLVDCFEIIRGRYMVVDRDTLLDVKEFGIIQEGVIVDRYINDDSELLWGNLNVSMAA